MSKSSEYNDALAAINEYADHQREQNPRTFEAGYDTEEYRHLQERVEETEQNLPWWRR